MVQVSVGSWSGGADGVHAVRNAAYHATSDVRETMAGEYTITLRGDPSSSSQDGDHAVRAILKNARHRGLTCVRIKAHPPTEPVKTGDNPPAPPRHHD